MDASVALVYPVCIAYRIIMQAAARFGDIVVVVLGATRGHFAQFTDKCDGAAQL